MKVLVTGAAGYIGKQLIQFLMNQTDYKVVATDILEDNPFQHLPNVEYIRLDIRSNDVTEVMKKQNVDVVVHLASIVTPGKKSNREFEYSVDVLGTKNILEACAASNVKRIVISSSGAAYGYHPENRNWLKETDPIRGNYEFAYSYHKRLVEEMLKAYRQTHPELEQTIFRIGTILGSSVSNQITNLFEKPFVYSISGSDSPFVFIWDKDVVRCFAKAIVSEQTGIYNLAGDGALSVKDIAALMGKRVLTIPTWVATSTLFVLKRMKLSQYGEEQVRFLKYRPVLENKKLKEHFGYIPEKTSREVFQFYLQNNEYRQSKSVKRATEA